MAKGMFVMLGEDGKDTGASRNLREEASLFMWFVNAVNSQETRGTSVREKFPLDPRKKVKQKIKFKTYSTSADSIMYEKSSRIAFEEDRNGFICAHCDARYIYKRCLVNHLIKSHRIDSNTLSKTFQ